MQWADSKSQGRIQSSSVLDARESVQSNGLQVRATGLNSNRKTDRTGIAIEASLIHVLANAECLRARTWDFFSINAQARRRPSGEVLVFDITRLW
jgi:hypothetical protein